MQMLLKAFQVFPSLFATKNGSKQFTNITRSIVRTEFVIYVFIPLQKKFTKVL